jgi:hypothetical protein
MNYIPKGDGSLVYRPFSDLDLQKNINGLEFKPSGVHVKLLPSPNELDLDRCSEVGSTVVLPQKQNKNA